MKPFVRRSHLLVDVLDREAVNSSWTHNADAVILAMPTGALDRSSAREPATGGQHGCNRAPPRCSSLRTSRHGIRGHGCSRRTRSEGIV